MVSFFNEYDYAVGLAVEGKGGWWRFGQYIKPILSLSATYLGADGDDLRRYQKDASGAGDSFCSYLSTDPINGMPICEGELRLVKDNTGHPPLLDDQFKVLSYGAQAYGNAIGATNQTERDILLKPGILFDGFEDIKLLFHTGNDSGEAVKAIYHGGQFRSNLPARKDFWGKFISDLNVTPPLQPRL